MNPRLKSFLTFLGYWAVSSLITAGIVFWLIPRGYGLDRVDTRYPAVEMISILGFVMGFLMWATSTDPARIGPPIKNDVRPLLWWFGFTVFFMVVFRNTIKDDWIAAVLIGAFLTGGGWTFLSMRADRGRVRINQELRQTLAKELIRRVEFLSTRVLTNEDMVAPIVKMADYMTRNWWTEKDRAYAQGVLQARKDFLAMAGADYAMLDLAFTELTRETIDEPTARSLLNRLAGPPLAA